MVKPMHTYLDRAVRPPPPTPHARFTLPINYNTLTPAQRKAVRLQYIQLQNNLCCHCKGSLDKPSISPISTNKINKSLFPPNFFKYHVHLHHCHRTGLTIGAVHNHCNAILWQFYGE
jgi:hypothetical protein